MKTPTTVTPIIGIWLSRVLESGHFTDKVVVHLPNHIGSRALQKIDDWLREEGIACHTTIAMEDSSAIVFVTNEIDAVTVKLRWS